MFPFCGSPHLIDPPVLRFSALCPHGVMVTWVHRHGQDAPEPECEHR